MNTIAFAFNFAVWTMFSVIGLKIKQELGLSNTQFGILIATPILSGSISRIPFGFLTDHFGGRVVFFMQMLVVSGATYSLALATQYWQYLLAGLFVGLAGGSFAIGIAYTSAWFDKDHQGTAMGIFGAGNSGAAITNLTAPMIIVAAGWRSVPEIYSVAMIIVAIFFWIFTYNEPKSRNRLTEKKYNSIAEQLEILKEQRVWRFGLYYFFTFGGFVAIALWLPQYYVSEYSVDIKTASVLTALFTLPAGFIRIIGGYISDKVGARIVNWWVFWVSASCLFFLSYPETNIVIKGVNDNLEFKLGLNIYVFTLLIFVVGFAQSLGKASVYKSLYDYFPANMGLVGGIVGAIGGVGGFVLPILFGLTSDYTNIRSSCFMLLFVLVAACMLWMNFSIIHAKKENEFL